MESYIKNLKAMNPSYHEGLDPRIEIKRFMQLYRWDSKDLSEVIGVSVGYISMFLNDKTGLTMALAQKISLVFYGTMEDWMMKEILYKKSEIVSYEDGEDIRKRVKIYMCIPVRELVRRGWISQYHTINELLSEMIKHLSRQTVDSIQNWQPVDIPSNGFFRTITEPIRERLWIMKAVEISNSRHYVDYNQEIIQETLKKFSSLSDGKRDIFDFLCALTKGGVQFYVLPNLSEIYILGALFWHGLNPIIVYTLENKEPDVFWKFIDIISNLVNKYNDNPQHIGNETPNDTVLISDVLLHPKIRIFENNIDLHLPIKGKHVTLVYAKRIPHSLTRLRKGAISKHSFIPYEYYANENSVKMNEV